MKYEKISLISLIFLILISEITGAATITVDNSDGADYPSIQVAVDNAKDGDVIIVNPGNYRENIDV